MDAYLLPDQLSELDNSYPMDQPASYRLPPLFWLADYANFDFPLQLDKNKSSKVRAQDNAGQEDEPDFYEQAHMPA